MGFLSALRNFLVDGGRQNASTESLERLRNAWDLDVETNSPAAPGLDAASASSYDRLNWRRKLRTVFEKLPASESEWPGLMTEARALNFDADWVQDGLVEEFTMLIRRLLADRRLSEDELVRIQKVRTLVGISEEQAANVVESVVADASQFFGGVVVEEG